MPYSVRIEQFRGPLDLLLQLVEKNELEITEISLRDVTAPYLEHLEAHRGSIEPEELADFLIVAAKLVYLKSRALIPDLMDAALEEGPDLATQLRLYRAFVEAAELIGERTKHGPLSYGRTKRFTLERSAGFIPPVGLTADLLHEMYERVVERLQPIMNLPKAALERVVSIEEKIRELSERVKRAASVSFHRILSESTSRAEMVVSFLALLELIKQRLVSIKQKNLFAEIHLESTR